jgi:hypothetical protein
MYLMIEAWTPKPAWLALSARERADYVAGVGEGVAALPSAIAQAGWYEYFDQVDFGGEAGPPDAVLRHHIELQANAA